VSDAYRPTVTIIGAGLSGPLMAAYLGRAGYPVRLLEMRPDPRKAGSAGGRSINLALSRRGLHALEEVGVAQAVRKIGLPMRGRMMHAVSGRLSFQPYGTEADQVLLSVSRGELNMLLLDAAEQNPNVSVVFGHKCQDVDLDTNTAVFTDSETGRTVLERAEILIGADGAFSKLRAAMQRTDRFDYSQDFLRHGYKELSLPPAAGGDFALARDALHIWPRRTYMMIALPNLDRTFTCTLFWPFEGTPSFDSLRDDDAVRAFFRRTFPDFVPLMPDLGGEYARNPVGSLVTVRCRPWHVGGKAVLLGDACHAVVPFYGQGMNAAFEDCTVLNACLARHAPDWEAAFRDYQERRKENVDTLADMALDNFVEMRDHVGSRSFLVRKTVERTLHRLFPRWYVPLYTMATFTRMPYVQAVRRARRQDRVVVSVGASVLILIVVLVFLALGR
jgi:kynurenine 3-monooxygenase